VGNQDTVQYLVRPDGYIGARCPGRDVHFVAEYLERWLNVRGRARWREGSGA
jgi:hypothetical protein